MRLPRAARRPARGLAGLLLAVSCTAPLAQVPPEESSEPGPGGVVLFEERVFEIADLEHATERVQARLRIENATARRHGRLTIRTSQSVRLAKLSAEVFDAQERSIRTADEGAVQTFRPDETVHLASDLRVQVADLDPGMYPCEIAYSYELQYTSLLFWPQWMPQRDLPVRRATYELGVPPGIGFHTLGQGDAGSPDTLATEPVLRLRWSVTELEPTKEERLAPAECNLARETRLLICPDEFILEGQAGELTSWDAFGDWYRRLAQGRDELRPAMLEDAEGAVPPGATELQRVGALLRLLQSRTRYVAIEVGLGSYQPPYAEQTYARRYGDCKGLATLMIAMCRAAGLAAYPALVLTRDRGRIPKDFVSPMFNHMLVWVPIEAEAGGDTMWIECTSDHVAPGELPWQCEGCDALLIGPQGSRLALTPASPAEDNRSRCAVAGIVTPNGDLALAVRMELTGECALGIAEPLAIRSTTEQCAYLRETLSDRHPHLSVRDPLLQAAPDSCGRAWVLTFNATLPGFWRAGVDRVLCVPVVLGALGNRDLPRAEDRQCPLFLGFPFCEAYELSLRLPQGFAPEALPAETVLAGPGFMYNLAHTWDAGTWRVTRRQRSEQALVAADDYAAYREAVEVARRAESAPLIFRWTAGVGGE